MHGRQAAFTVAREGKFMGKLYKRKTQTIKCLHRYIMEQIIKSFQALAFKLVKRSHCRNPNVIGGPA